MIKFENRLEMLYEIPEGGECCEVGVFAGDFSKQIAGICDPSRLVLVDSFAAWSFSCDENGGNPRTLSGEFLMAEAKALTVNVSVPSNGLQGRSRLEKLMLKWLDVSDEAERTLLSSISAPEPR